MNIKSYKDYEELFKPYNFIDILINTGFSFIDPFEEINEIKNNLPKNANLESVKIFSELISNQK